MDASVADLRNKTREILKALDRRESVNILCYGKLKATIVPMAAVKAAPKDQHPFFGSAKKDGRTAGEVMRKLRGGRRCGL